MYGIPAILNFHPVPRNKDQGTVPLKYSDMITPVYSTSTQGMDSGRRLLVGHWENIPESGRF